MAVAWSPPFDHLGAQYLTYIVETLIYTLSTTIAKLHLTSVKTVRIKSDKTCRGGCTV